MNVDDLREQKVFDVLKLFRRLPDGALFKGERGRYFFREEPDQDNLAGSVMLNRKYLTGLFRPKNATKYRKGLKFIGDYDDKYLSFVQSGKDEITILWRPKPTKKSKG